MIKRGKILAFEGSPASGIGHMIIACEDDERVERIPCDNGATVRGLEACFGNVIRPGHVVDNSRGGHVGQEVYYSIDELGMFLGFTPVALAPVEVVEAYEYRGPLH